MCNECDATKGWKFCPHCGAELCQTAKQESKQSMSQEEFDKIFLGMLKGARKVVWLTHDGEESEFPTCRFELRNSNDEWMFDIDLNSEKKHFWFSLRVLAHFRDKYGLQYEDAQQLMENLVKQLFKLNDVTLSYRSYAEYVRVKQLFKLNDVTPVPLSDLSAVPTKQHFKLNRGYTSAVT